MIDKQNKDGIFRYDSPESIIIKDNCSENFVYFIDSQTNRQNLSQIIQLGNNSVLNHFIFFLITDSQSFDFALQVKASGENSICNLFGFYFVLSQNQVEIPNLKISIDNQHLSPNCQSDIKYKGIVGGKGAKVDWRANTFIAKQAKGTCTYELNRNLVLTKGATVVSVPNLEILTGDIVKAGHASTTGKIDQEQVFYLQTRQLSEKKANELIARGFAYEIFNQISPQIRECYAEKFEQILQNGLGKIGVVCQN